MALFPLFVDLSYKSCLVVGAGTVATRRIKVLCEFGCRVIVCSPQISSEVRSLADTGAVEVWLRPFRDQDVNGMNLVVAATDDTELNLRIVMLSASIGVLANNASSSMPAQGAFAFPAVVRRGEVVVGVSSSGTDPRLSKHICHEIGVSLPAWCSGLETH